MLRSLHISLAIALSSALLCAAPALAATVGEYPTPSSTSAPFAIVAGPEGSLWFTEQGTVNMATLKYSGGRVGRVTPKGAISEYAIPTADSQPQGITVGRDGALWFTEGQTDRIGRLDPAHASPGTSNGISEYTLPTAHASALGIAAGPDRALWFTEAGSDKIGRLDPAQASPGTSNGVTEFPLAASAGPQYIVAGPDGNLWFTEFDANKLGQITPGGTVTLLSPPTRGNPLGIAVGGDGAIWFTQANGLKIDRLPAPYTSTTSMTEYKLSGSTSNPGPITAGPDGALWFSETQRDVIGRITTGGTISETPLPQSGRAPLGIASGPDGAVWFAETAGFVGRIAIATGAQGRSGPGEQQGPSGPRGPTQVATEPQGQTSPPAPLGPAGPPKPAARVVCTVRAKRHGRGSICVVSFLSPGPRQLAVARLTRGRVVYARARRRLRGRRATLALHARRRLAPGTYTLTLVAGHMRLVQTVVIA